MNIINITYTTKD